jgi:hypothetical protein
MNTTEDDTIRVLTRPLYKDMLEWWVDIKHNYYLPDNSGFTEEGHKFLSSHGWSLGELQRIYDERGGYLLSTEESTF